MATSQGAHTLSQHLSESAIRSDYLPVFSLTRLVFASLQDLPSSDGQNGIEAVDVQ